jgi:hypothetical protein
MKKLQITLRAILSPLFFVAVVLLAFFGIGQLTYEFILGRYKVGQLYKTLMN